MEVRRVPGTSLANAATGEAVYTPPDGEALLRQKLANWEHSSTKRRTSIR